MLITGKLIEISCGPQVEDYRPFMMSQKECFLENVALQSLPLHSHWSTSMIHI